MDRGESMDFYRFLLYVTGVTARTERAIANLRRLCDEELAGRYELTIVDVLDRPDVAERERILATPLLVKDAPLPKRRITGDLSDPRRVLHVLGLSVELRPRAERDQV